MKRLKYYTIFLEGIDKTGKDTIRQYIWNLDKRLNVLCRGWPSMFVYNIKYKRNCEYALPYRDAIYVHCTADKEDWKIRCCITNEQLVDYDADLQLFKEAFNVLCKNYYLCLEFNTSHNTPYEIANKIVKYVSQLNGELNENKSN